MTTIRCLLNSKINGNRTINEYMLKSGQYITEVVTELGNGEKGIREIYKSTQNPHEIEKVVDNVFGKLEVFYPAKIGVIQEVEGIKCQLPNISIDTLLKEAK